MAGFEGGFQMLIVWSECLMGISGTFEQSLHGTELPGKVDTKLFIVRKILLFEFISFICYLRLSLSEYVTEPTKIFVRSSPEVSVRSWRTVNTFSFFSSLSVTDIVYLKQLLSSC